MKRSLTGWFLGVAVLGVLLVRLSLAVAELTNQILVGQVAKILRCGAAQVVKGVDGHRLAAGQRSEKPKLPCAILLRV